MVKFISLGSGSSGNCYCLLNNDDGLMIDAGVGIRRMKKFFLQYGISMSKIHHILLTHDHRDHTKSVGMLSQKYGLPVYAVDKVHQGIATNFYVKKKIPAEKVQVIEKGKPFDVGNFRVTSFGVPHDSFDNVGYRIECEGITFCLITDAGHVTEEMKSYVNQADYLVIEANHDEEMLAQGSYPYYLKERISGPKGHLCNRLCAETLAENLSGKIKQVWLCHLSEENNLPDLAFNTVTSILNHRGIIVGKDFELNVLQRTMPSGFYELT